MAMLICGDCWHLSLPYLAVHDGADLLLVLAASAVEGLSETVGSRAAWERMNRSYALSLSSFVLFSNIAGEEQGLSFWGGSHVVKPDGNIQQQAKIGEDDLIVCNLDLNELRAQRLMLPFRRDDSLALTVEIGRHVLRSKGRRNHGFQSMVEPARRSVDLDVSEPAHVPYATAAAATDDPRARP
jgi:predicted amidohydrolase